MTALYCDCPNQLYGFYYNCVVINCQHLFQINFEMFDIVFIAVVLFDDFNYITVWLGKASINLK